MEVRIHEDISSRCRLTYNRDHRFRVVVWQLVLVPFISFVVLPGSYRERSEDIQRFALHPSVFQVPADESQACSKTGVRKYSVVYHTFLRHELIVPNTTSILRCWRQLALRRPCIPQC